MTTRASTLLTDSQRADVERAITDAEQNTSAQVVLVIASRSGAYDRAEDLFALVFALIAIVPTRILWDFLSDRAVAWTNHEPAPMGLVATISFFALWLILGASLATRFPALAKPFIPRAQAEAEVRRRGLEAFHLARVGHTSRRNGLLIFVSLYERTAWISGDEALSRAIPHDDVWVPACNAVTDAFKRRDHAQGLIKAVRLCAAALAQHFPPDVTSPSADELPNHIHFMD